MIDWLLAITTIFFNAVLLFSLQPLIAKQIIPYFGGSAAVWSCCLVFFQGVLLLGYFLAASIRAQRQFIALSWLVAVLLLISSFLLKFGVDAVSIDAATISTDPVRILLLTLFSVCGMQATLLALGAPLQQALYARLAPDKNPYLLYGASNAGSLLGLISYPLLIEPMLGLKAQNVLWASVFKIFTILFIVLLLRTSLRSKSEESIESEGSTPFQWSWLIIPALSSSLLVSITAYIATDIAPIPLLWIIPFALFLLSYAAAFGGSRVGSSELLIVCSKLFVTIAVLCWIAEAHEPFFLLAPIFLIAFTSLCFGAHQKLYELRPEASYLTRYYLFTSIGGFAGGIFGSMLAPLLFVSSLELPLGFCLLLMASSSGTYAYDRRQAFYLLVGVLLSVLFIFLATQDSADLGSITLWAWTPSIFACYFASRSSRALGFSLSVVTLSLLCTRLVLHPSLFEDRNFFGTLSVRDAASLRTLSHGITIHGSQKLDTRSSCVPTAYYHPNGPAGNVLTALQSIAPDGTIGVVGLGAGALSCYATSEQTLAFYEINSIAIGIAQDEKLFTYLKNSAARSVVSVLGDARLSLKGVADSHFDLLVVDAFSSDSIPVHLLTLEALKEYLRVLKPQGSLLFHISNKYLDLEPVLSSLAEPLRLRGKIWFDESIDPSSLQEGKLGSRWCLLSISDNTINSLTRSGRWQELGKPSGVVWTDDFSSIVPLLHLF